ncbi:ubiquitin 3 binding protein But2 C-terminal domain-containing protein [Xylariales sp. PMI_506]|nr:ubiquitin 3 binding protein But2 C-terminal domain-containing protein [Xylariales sp. PMI_506]
MLALLALLVSGILFASLSQSQAITLRANAGCSFHLSTGGGGSQLIGQLDSGQCRAGSDINASTFTWFGDAFLDSQGRAPTNVLQCDVNQQPAHGFNIGCDGSVTYNGQSTFYQCATGDGDEVNIYLQSNDSQCQPILILSDGCTSCQNTGSPSPNPQPATTSNPLGAGSSPVTVTPFTSPLGQSSSPAAGNPMPSASPKPKPATLPAPSNDCPANISGNYIPPSLLVPIDSANPTMAYGSTTYGQVSPNASTIFNFAIPATAGGYSCKVFFLLPTASTSSYYLTGDGSVLFARISDPADATTTTFQSVMNGMGIRTLGALSISRGNAYVVEAYDCPAGQTVSYMMAEPLGKDTCLVYLQDAEGGWNNVGMFISIC